MSSTSIEGNVNQHLDLLSYSETLSTTFISLAIKKVLFNLTSLVQNSSVDLEPIKLGLTNVNNIFTLTSMQRSLNLNQIIFQRKIYNQLEEFLDI